MTFLKALKHIEGTFKKPDRAPLIDYIFSLSCTKNLTFLFVILLACVQADR